MVYTWSAYPSFVVVVQTYTLFGFDLFLFCVVLIMVLVGGIHRGLCLKTQCYQISEKKVWQTVFMWDKVGQDNAGRQSKISESNFSGFLALL